MAWTTIDDSAAPHTVDEAMCSVWAHKLARNIETIDGERWPKLGYSQIDGSGHDERYCSVLPQPVGFFPLRIPATDRQVTIRMRLRYQCQWSIGTTKSNGTNAMYVWLGLMYGDGRLDQPPGIQSDWDDGGVRGELLTVAASLAQLELTASPRSGWISAGSANARLSTLAGVLWIWSVRDSTAELTADILQQTTSIDGLVIDPTTGSFGSTANPNERAVLIEPRYSESVKTSEDQSAIAHQIMYHDTNVPTGSPGDAALLYLWPPLRMNAGEWTAADTCDIYTMGTIRIASAMVEAEPTAQSISRRHFRNAQQARQDGPRALISRASQLCIHRVQQYGGMTEERALGSTSQWRPWLFLSGIAGGGAAVDAGGTTHFELSTSSGSPTNLRSIPIATPVPTADDNGYEVIIGLLASTTTGGGRPNIRLRAALFEWDGTADTEGDWNSDEPVPLAATLRWGSGQSLGRGDPEAAASYQLWGIESFPEGWQYRGYLTQDFRGRGNISLLVQWHSLFVDPPAAYPTEIRVQGYGDDSNCRIAVVGAWAGAAPLTLAT